ncbi:hypothetical protein ZIOFF_069131 [Zingiber officinale]|uniref:dUTP diphosphatase n=1 Tax=Zingiber officinale TaxID=94328 RepID=A0A8J5C3Q0_ZINOF|nr:hypothetical protein ZIOFF_069131 [Zingiber officinale]
MSRRWEEKIQEWYTKSHTSNLEYLDLAQNKEQPTKRELAHNLSVIYDRVCLSCRVHLKNFKIIQEQLEDIRKENKELKKALENLAKETIENRLLSEKQLKSIVVEQPKLTEQQVFKISEDLQKKLTQVELLLQRVETATEGIEAPALGFCRPAEYKGATSSSTAIIKQANTQIQLLVSILEKLESLEERIKKIEGKIAVSSNLQQETALPDNLIQSLTDRIKTLSIQEKPKESKAMMARTRAQDPPVTTTITRPGDARVFEDQIREYHQAHRRRYNAQRTIQRMAGHITGRTYTRSLEQQMDPQVQLRLSMQERAAIVPAEVLYHSRRDDVHHRVYVHRSEEALLVTRNQVDLSFIQPESYAQLQRSGMRFIHMGVIQVRIQILHRQEEGTLALVVFRDNRWQGDQAIFATMEIDLTNGSQLVYVIPNTMLTISDFYRNIQISVLTRGYEGWQNSEANLLITRGLVGRLSNTPNVGFAYEVQNVVDYLASHGVRALPGRSYSTRDVIGQNWTVRPSSANIPVEPTEVNTRNLLNGSISLQFTNYQATTTNHPTYNLNDEEIQSDEEEIRNHIVSVLIESPIPREEELLVKRISSLALLPQRRTAGSAGYDLAISYPQEIAARTRSMMATGICIQVPKGTYARIAPRYSAALRGLIIMGGVIDSDYRGELKIIVYNATDSDIFLDQQECIAQIILERIATPPVREVAELANTSRADQGFGSTNQICSRYLANPYCVGCQYCDDDADYHPQPIHELEPEPEIVPETSTRKGKDPLEIRLKTEEAIEEEIRQIQHQARIRAIEDHKFYEDEAYCQLTEGTWAHSIATTKRMLRDSREYRRQLQALLDVDDPNASSSSAYASGKFYPPKSTIDAEIYTVMNSLNNFKIYYLDKEEFLIRTDCQAIISFFNKSSQNKPSRVRWIAFTDFITGLGIPVHGALQTKTK